jgi:hypothetical protein
MNYHLYLFGIHRETFDIIAKLLIQTFRESDYFLKTFSKIPENYYSPLSLRLSVTGSKKEEYEKIVLDFDNVVALNDGTFEIISPKSLEISYSPDASHYWGVAGKLFAMINDISPAFISGYLLSAKLKNEIELFRKYSK